jgi:hypothetical protein
MRFTTPVLLILKPKNFSRRNAPPHLAHRGIARTAMTVAFLHWSRGRTKLLWTDRTADSDRRSFSVGRCRRVLGRRYNDATQFTLINEARMSFSRLNRTLWSTAIAVLAIWAFHPASANAQIIDEPVRSAPPPANDAVEHQSTANVKPADDGSVTRPLGKPYYIEFRSRSAQSYGHTFAIYGRLNANGRIQTKTVVGLHPASESPVPWMIGHFVLVPSETGASDGDTEDQYVTARFQILLSADEYKKVVGYIKGLQGKSPVWHAVLYNCNAFVGDIAKFMGMEAPGSTMLMPAEYINSLRDLNIKKSAGLIGTPKNVASAEQLRAEALRSGGRGHQQAAAASAEAKPAPAKPEAGPDRAKPSRSTAPGKDQHAKKQTESQPGQIDSPNLSPN